MSRLAQYFRELEPVKRLQDFFAAQLGENYVYNDLIIELSVVDLQAEFDLDMAIDILALLDLNVGNLLNVYNTPNEVNCLFSIFDYNGLIPRKFDVHFTDVSLKFDYASRLTDAIKGLLTLIELFLSNGASLGSGATSSDSAESAVIIFLSNTIAQAKEECIGIDLGGLDIAPLQSHH